MLRLVYALPLRQTEGFLTSILALMGVDLRVPDHTTLCDNIYATTPLITDN